MATTTNIAVPAGAWTAVQAGPTGALVGATDNFEFAYAASAPADTLSGHAWFAGQGSMRAAPLDGETFWVRNRNRPFTIAKTPEE